MAIKLRVSYHRPQDLVRDNDQQFVQGGLLVRVADASGLDRGSTVGLELCTTSGVVHIEAQVIQPMPGVGVALGFDPNAPGLADAVAAARTAGTQDGPEAVHELVGNEPAPGPEPGDQATQRESPAGGWQKAQDVHTRMRNATQTEKIQIAMRGTRDERGFIIRDPTAKSLHRFVLKNPKLQLDEVASIAALRSVSPEILKFIGGRREWSSRPEVASALVRNPKTPVPLALKMVPYLSTSELRRITKHGGVRGPILRQIRKTTLG